MNRGEHWEAHQAFSARCLNGPEFRGEKRATQGEMWTEIEFFVVSKIALIQSGMEFVEHSTPFGYVEIKDIGVREKAHLRKFHIKGGELTQDLPSLLRGGIHRKLQRPRRKYGDVRLRVIFTRQSLLEGVKKGS